LKYPRCLALSLESDILRAVEYYTSWSGSGRSQWQRGLRRGFSAARLLGLRVRIPPGSCMSLCCECCVLSGRGLCVGLITCTEESYRVWCVWVCSWSVEKWGGLGPPRGCRAIGKKEVKLITDFHENSVVIFKDLPLNRS
jgi:hypothetical protein